MSRKVLTSMGVYTVLGFAPVAVGFLLVPLYVSKLDAAGLGRVTAHGVTQTFATIAIAFGLDSAFTRFYFDTKSSDDMRRLVGTVVGAVTASFVALLAVGALAGVSLMKFLWNDLPWWPFGPAALLGGYVQILFGVMYAYYRNSEELVAVVVVSLGMTLASVGGAILGVLWRPDASGVVLGRIGCSSTFVIGCAVVFAWRVRVAWGEWALLKRLFRYGIPLLGYTVVAYVLFNGDRILVERWFSVSVLGAYALAATLIAPLEIFFQAGLQAVQPTLYRMLAHENRLPAARLMNQTYALLFGVVLGLGGGVVLLAPWALRTFAKAEFEVARGYVSTLFVAQLFRVIWSAHAFPLFYSKATTSFAPISVAALSVGLCVAWWGNDAGPFAVAWGVVAWKSAQMLLTMLVARHKSEVRARTGGLVAVAVVLVGLGALLEFSRVNRPLWVDLCEMGLGAVAVLSGGAIVLRTWKTSRERSGEASGRRN